MTAAALPAGAAKAPKKTRHVSAVVSPRGFASRFCTVFFDFQVAALDYREPIGEASARPVDVGQARLARARLGAALATLSATKRGRLASFSPLRSTVKQRRRVLGAR